MWGDNTYGQLGIGTIDHNELSPALVNLKNSVSVTCGGFHTAVKAGNTNQVTLFAYKPRRRFVCFW